jgi:hypothetical protein
MSAKNEFTLFEFDEFARWLTSLQVSRDIRWLQNHHTYIPSYAHFDGDNYLLLLRSMEAGHLDSGLSAIAQHLTTFPDGKIALCRDLDQIPAGIKGANTYGVCIEHLGNFDRQKDVMSDAQRQTILRLNALLCRKFGLLPGTDTIVYHHWYDLVTGERTDGAGTTKSCPGTHFFGGNSVRACRKYFIPGVKEALRGCPE